MEVVSYENASDPSLVSSETLRQQNLRKAEQLYVEEEATLKELLKIQPNDNSFKASLDNVQVRLATVRYRLHNAPSEQQVRAALAELKTDAARDKASPMVLDLVVTASLRVEPSSLREPAYALAQAKRGADLTHHKSPDWLLSLSEAYQADGKQAEARATAEEGLALLPPAGSDGETSRLRKLLQMQASAP
jgi:hypothetical protein